MRSARFGFREEPLKKEEPRASVMPSHLPSLDPLFMDAAIHDFAPMSDGEKDALMEKMGCVLYGRGK